MNIRTEHVYPPIAIRHCDWSAVDDDTYEPGCPVGRGATETAAVKDLLDQFEENDVPRADLDAAYATWLAGRGK